MTCVYTGQPKNECFCESCKSKKEANFDDKVSAITKSLLKQDKRHSNKSAKEIATKIAGSIVKKEKPKKEAFEKGKRVGLLKQKEKERKERDADTSREPAQTTLNRSRAQIKTNALSKTQVSKKRYRNKNLDEAVGWGAKLGNFNFEVDFNFKIPKTKIDKNIRQIVVFDLNFGNEQFTYKVLQNQGGFKVMFDFDAYQLELKTGANSESDFFNIFERFLEKRFNVDDKLYKINYTK